MNPEDKKQQVTDAYRLLAKRTHPDKEGGDDDAMRALNILHDAAEEAWDPDTVDPAADVYVEVDDNEPRASGEQSSDDPSAPMIWEGSTFPRGAAERIRAYSWAEYSDWLTGRYFARTDQIFLANCLLGLNLRERPHRALANFMVHKNPGVDLGLLDPDHRKRILLAPRGTGKTHFVRAEITQWLLNYVNIRIVFLSGGENVAVPQLEAIKKGFSQPTAAMQRYFPEYVQETVWNKKKKQFEDVLISDWGTMHHFTLPNRTNTTLPEASFTLATQESVSSGIHADVIFVDDLQNNANSKTKEALAKTHKSYLDVLPLLMPQGYLILTGTRYSGNPPDVYGRIMAQATKESSWKFMVEDAESYGCTVCGQPDYFHENPSVNHPQPLGLIPGYECAGFVSDGVKKCFCPQIACPDGSYGHTLKYLEDQKAEDETFYYLQFMNDPSKVEATAVVFTEELLSAQTFHDLQWLAIHCPRAFSKVFACADLAFTVGARSDSTVIYIFSVYQGQIFIWHCISGKMNASTRISAMVDLLLDHRFRPIQQLYVEATLNNDSTKLLLESAAKDAGLITLPVTFLDPPRAKDSKQIRIDNCEQVLKARRLWLYSGMPDFEKLLNQLLKKNTDGHDDHADAMAMCCAAPTHFLVETSPSTPQRNNSQRNWLRDLNSPQEPESDGQSDGLHFSF